MRKFQREDFVNAAYEIVRSEGIQGVNARRIAKALNCSVQPIYHNFTTMEELKSAVIEKIHCTYVSYMKEGAKEERAYLGMGLSYIRFARDYPNFFKLLFMAKSRLSPHDFIINDDKGNGILHQGQSFSGLTGEQQKAFHLKVWVFTHGIATLAATDTVKFTDEEIQELLAVTTREMLIGFKHTQEQEENTCTR